MKQLLTLLLLLTSASLLAQNGLTGTVTGTGGQTLPGASVRLTIGTGKPVSMATGAEGTFHIDDLHSPITLFVRFIGYKDTTVALNTPLPSTILIRLQPANRALQEVTVSTGYQDIPKERATGSFVQLDRATIERGVSTSLTDRLRDLVPGLSFLPGSATDFRIRGQSTIFSNASPLIVVDGFPYNQPISNINPNDVESISVLKDAAAASIWGSKAGNGVVVITTKRGQFNKPPSVTANTSIQYGQKPDLNYGGYMSSADYISIEKRLFSEGFYTATETNTQHLPLSPVIELLIAQRNGTQTAAAVSAQLDALSQHNAHDDMANYFYRPSLNQQYSASISGGSAHQRYFFSAGADQNADNLQRNGLDRLTINTNNTWTFNQLEFSAGLNLSESQTTRDNPGSIIWNRGAAIYPYADLSGPLTHDYRQSFLTSAQNIGFLDWQYRPLDELALTDNTSKLSAQRINTSVKYHLPLGFSVQAFYQFDHGLTSGRNYQDAASYYTRNLINRYTQVSGTTLNRPIPIGGILDLSTSASFNHDGRIQAAYDHTVGKGELTAIAGYELQTLHVTGDAARQYGFDTGHATSVPVDQVTLFPYYDNTSSGSSIPSGAGETDATDHYRSYYGNAAYTYDSRFTVSASARLDQSNLFGVSANQKGVPLWSAGALWSINKEKFYAIGWLPELKLRATYGYNGNINKSLSALTTATYLDGGQQATLIPFARIINPPNSELRWERVRNINLAIDFATKDRRISGSIEYYLKKGIDLIGKTTYAPSTGITLFTGNTAGTMGHGLDIQLSSRNLCGKLSWTTDYYASFLSEKVDQYDLPNITVGYLDPALSPAPMLGHPLYSIYSYAWAGLDASGDPQGYLNGTVSKNYTAMAAATSPQDLVYNGPARPTLFGALRNTLTYQNISLSANISYEFGFYFRKRSLRSGNDYGLTQQNTDYALRWQKPGDEANTYVPAVVSVPNLARDDFYTYSSVLVQKGDNIRLRDVRLSYTWHKLECYLYGTDLGILWRANKLGIDPDYNNNIPVPRSFAAGIRLTY